MRLRRLRTGDPLGAHAAFDVDDAFEQGVELLARMVMRLTVLADRYERAVVNGVPAATVTRVARLRSVSESGRDTLVGLALWDRPGAAQGERGNDRQEDALATRTVIGQAQGMLMHRCRVGPAEALEMLLVAARDRDVTLGQLAREVMGMPPGNGATEPNERGAR